MKRWLVMLVLVAVCCLGLWACLYREIHMQGDDFRNTVLHHRGNSYASWSLYQEDEFEYCIKLDRPIVPERFCVPKKDIEIRNADNGGSEMGVIYKDEWVLKKDRYAGAKEEIF